MHVLYSTVLTLKISALGLFQARLLVHQESPQCFQPTDQTVSAGNSCAYVIVLSIHSQYC